MSSEAEEKRGDEFYSLNRDTKETTRLNKQHRVFTQAFGFLIHPSNPSPFSKPNLRIADFATGTGIWPIDVSGIVPATCQIDGYDISGSQFPPSSELPANVSLYEHDILKPLKSEYHEYYDIISVRALVSTLADDEWEKAVANITRCLKPGGYLQWIDPDCSITGWRPVSFATGASIAGLQKGIDTVRTWAKFLGRSLDSSNRLPGYFCSQGLEVVQHDVMHVDGERAFLVDFTREASKAWASLILRFSQMEGSGLSVEEAVQIGERMKRDADLGEAYFRLDMNIILGKKPEERPDSLAVQHRAR